MTLYHHPVVVVSYIVGRGGRGLMELGGGKIFFFYETKVTNLGVEAVMRAALLPWCLRSPPSVLVRRSA